MSRREIRAVDRIIDQYLLEYTSGQPLEKEDRARIFSAFTVESVMSRFVNGAFRGEDIIVDDIDDTGIDGIAIVTNGRLLCRPEGYREITGNGQSALTQLVFVQATIEKRFRQDKVMSFVNGVRDFLKKEPRLRRNPRIEHHDAIKAAVIGGLGATNETGPEVWLYFVSPGRWVEQQNAKAIAAQVEEDLARDSTYKSVRFEFIDGRSFAEFARCSVKRNEGVVQNFKLNALTAIPPVKAAFLGAILADDLIGLVSRSASEDGDGGGGGGERRLDPTVFSSNVRSFLGPKNHINNAIAGTLCSNDVSLFTIMNNGITIVCRDCEAIGPMLHLYDYQIVNGCQTSSMIFAHRDRVMGRNVLVHARIVACDDPVVIKKIIHANNSQSKVTEEHMLSLLPFNRLLECYYAAMRLAGDGPALYYDIRRGSAKWERHIDAGDEEHDWIPGTHNIVTVYGQLKAYAAMFLGLPHLAIAGADKLRTRVSDTIFNEAQDDIEPYYSAAYAMHCFAEMVRDGTIHQKYVPFRFHFLHLMELLMLSQVKGDAVQSRVKISFAANEILSDRQATKRCFQCFAAAIDRAIDAMEGARHIKATARDPTFTRALEAEWRRSEHQEQSPGQ